MPAITDVSMTSWNSNNSPVMPSALPPPLVPSRQLTKSRTSPVIAPILAPTAAETSASCQTSTLMVLKRYLSFEVSNLLGQRRLLRLFDGATLHDLREECRAAYNFSARPLVIVHQGRLLSAEYDACALTSLGFQQDALVHVFEQATPAPSDGSIDGRSATQSESSDKIAKLEQRVRELERSAGCGTRTAYATNRYVSSNFTARAVGKHSVQMTDAGDDDALIPCVPMWQTKQQMDQLFSASSASLGTWNTSNSAEL
eukprot:6178384-Pleurochrysis_carterae.AAC.2